MTEVLLLTNNRTNSEQLVVTMSNFDRLTYEVVEQINGNWFGVGNLPFSEYGGIKPLYDNEIGKKS